MEEKGGGTSKKGGGTSTRTAQDWLQSIKLEPGTPGLSAYAIALSQGFIGTINQWLDSLKANAIQALGQPNGAVSLDAGGKLVPQQIPVASLQAAQAGIDTSTVMTPALVAAYLTFS